MSSLLVALSAACRIKDPVLMLGYCYAIYRHATSVDCRGETDDVVNGGIVKALAVERVAARWLAARADRLVA